MTKNEVIELIDETHARCEKALRSQDLDSYMSIFADSLKYEQVNGKIIHKKQLIHDQKRAWSRIVDMKLKYCRLESSFIDNTFSEVREQNLAIWIKVFWFIRTKWTYHRIGRFDWVQINGEWKINNVKILVERINEG